MQGYQFTTDSLQPEPEVLDNPYGSPTAVVSVTEPQGTGWQDPDFAFSTPGVDADGAWDVGPNGSITVTVPLAPPNSDPGISYRVEFHVYTVAYENPVALPVISAPGLTLENVASSVVTVKQDTIGRYRGITWTAEADVPAGNTATLAFTATSQGAVIDSIEIHTRYTRIGEPQHVYSAWVAANYPGETDPSIIGFNAAPDGDGIANGMKYFLGMGRTADRSVLSVTGADGDSLTFRHTRDKSGTPDVVGAYEWSLDLATWLPGGEESQGVSVAFDPAISDDSSPEYDELAVTTAVTAGTTQRIFVRLTVSQQDL